MNRRGFLLSGIAAAIAPRLPHQGSYTILDIDAMLNPTRPTGTHSVFWYGSRMVGPIHGPGEAYAWSFTGPEAPTP